MSFLLLLACVSVFSWLLFKVHRWKMESKAARIPGDRGLPIIGNGLPLLTARTPIDLMNFIKGQFEKYESYGIAKGWIGPLLLVGLLDPKYIEKVADSPNAEQKGNIYYHFLGDVFRGVFADPGGAEWKELRKPLMKLQAKKALVTDYHATFLRRNRNFIKFLKERRCGKEFDILHDLRHLTFEIISETHFGVDVDEVRNPKFFWLENLDRYILYTATSGGRSLFQFLKIFKKLIGHPKHVQECINDMLKYSEWVFEERKKHLRSGIPSDGKEYYPDFLIRRREEKGKPKRESFQELSDLISGGGDTTSVTLASALVFLAMFPDMQEEVHKELTAIFSDDPGRDPTVEDLGEMHFLGRCIKETLRIVGPFTFFKVSTGDVDLGDYTIPEGTLIAVFTEFLHLNPKYWERPGEFYPDHFLPEKEAARPHYAYMPFGYGLRICPGVQYATHSLKTVLSYIIRNFKVHTSLKFEECTYDYRFMRILTTDYLIRLEER